MKDLQVDPKSNDGCPHKRQRKDPGTQGRRPCGDGSRDWRDAATRNVNSQQKLEEARSRSLRREGSPADTSRAVRK